MKEIEMQKKTAKSMGTPSGFGSGSTQGYTSYTREPTVIPQRESQYGLIFKYFFQLNF
jgi:hypothetical protein